jgi:Tol biopolymer transport system component
MSIHRLRGRSHNKGSLPYRGLTCVVLAALACAAPGVARAHGGGQYIAGPAAAPPTVDGVIGASEWAGATAYTVPFGSLGNGTVRFVHTPTDLYVAAVVNDSTPGVVPSLTVFFDDDHDGVKDAGEDAWLTRVGTGGTDLFYSPTGSDGPSHYADSVGGGTNQTIGVANISGNDEIVFEQRHPLCSADAAHDICTSLGQTLGVNFQYDRSIPGVFANAPGPDLFDPSNNWADLILAANDITPPTVSVTAPTAGSVLRGTVSVTANASDNVGVTSVDFRYFGGELPFVELGTDTEAPYTATFDTTQVANTGVIAANIEAVAHDAAGNTTSAGNAVTIDNTTPSRIVFESDRAGNSEIYSISPAGTGVTRLTNSAAADSRPSLSPDGNLIAWESAGQVWVMASDGSNKQALTSDGTSSAPAFSPDGTKIAFQSDRGEGMDIWVMNADGTGQTNLTDAPGADVNPAWSPDGTRLAFDSDRSGNRDVFVMSADGTGSPINLTVDSLQLDADPDWSPDGTLILFVSARGATTSVWTMNTDGGDEVDVTTAGIYDADPSWSPDGAHIVFTRDAGGQTFNLWTARADGTAELRLTDAPGTQRNSFPDWGSRVAETIATLEPVADTFVRQSDPNTAHGTETTFDVHAGASVYCGQGPGPAYGLLRFDLSSLPAGVRVTDARLELTVAGGFAQDGDPNHYAIRLNSNAWSESVTWSDRPADGILPGPVGPPFGEATINGVPLSASQDVLGITNAFNNNCDANSGGPPVRTFTAPQDRAQNFTEAVGDVIGTGQLSAQIWSQPCGTATTVPCQNSQTEQAYFLRYYSREAAPALRPKLVVTYASAAHFTSFDATPVNPKAGIAQVDLDDVPASVLLAPSRTTESAPLGETPLGETPLGETPLGETPLGETPLGETSLGLDDLLADLRTVSLSSLPLLREGGWPAVLAPTALASRALQNVSLGDVFALTPRPAVLDGEGDDDITLGDLDYSRSSLGDVVAIAYALGSGVTLADLSGAFTNGVLDPELQSWCTITNTSCSQTSILSLGLKGAPLGETPLGETPLGETLLWDTPLGETPLGETPLGETPLGETPLGETPLGETATGNTPLGETPLGETPLGETPLGETRIDLRQAPLGETPLGETPLGETVLTRAPLGETPLGETQISDLDNCTAIFVTCPTGGTINSNLGALRSDATLSDLVEALANPNAFNVAQLVAVLEPWSDFTIAQVAAIFTEASGVTLADLVASLPNPNAFTLNDLLIAVLRAGAQWEQIDLSQPALAAVATGGGTVDLTSNLTVAGSSVLTFTVNLPSSWTPIDTGSIQSVASGATTLEVVDVESTPDGGTRHILRTQFAVTGSQQFHFSVRPGITLGPATVSLSVSTAQGTTETAAPDSVNVQETFEPNNDPATAPVLAPGSLYVSYLTSTSDTDFFRVNVPATGTRTTFRLSHLPKDYDLVVYGRQGTTPLVQPGGAAPLETPVLADSGAPITHLTEALPAETLDDLRLLSDRPVLGVSAFRTTEDEAVVAVSDGVPGEYIVQVKGYNGATSVQPYMLRVESEAPRLAPTCQPRFPGLSFGTAAGVNIASIPNDTDTLFLANGPQLGAAGGAGVVDWFTMTHLDQLRGTGHPSAVVRLEDDPAVRAAYTAWNLEPCSTARANAVVRAITDVVRTIRNARPAVRNLVLLGNDKALPFARLDDLTTIANEADYASTFARDQDLYGALFEHRVLSDDPYSTTDPIPYLQRQLFVPQLAVGRLVETAAQITGALDRFVFFGGDLDPTSARTTGYDFLKDGANGVAAAFAGIVGAQQPATNPPLIGDLWTSSTLAGALSTTTGLFGMNGHADHHRLQPAAGSELFAAANLPASLDRAVIFSMGCHSALSVSDAAIAQAVDWPQTYAGKGAAAYAGNLGFGYGDSITVAYSEALNVRLAQGLRNGLPIGEALVEAKQGYLASLGVVGVYDEKAMSELALYGLPMWSLHGATPPPATPPLPAGVTRLSTDPDPITGLMTDHYRSQPALNQQPPTAAGTYWTGPSGVQVTHLRPLQPKVEFPVAPDAHGALITGLESPADVAVDPVYARPIVDNSAAEPELPFADVAFPAKIQSLVSQQTRTGRRVSTVLVHGQFFSDDTADAKGAGHQRLFTRVDLDVLRSNGTDRVAPRFDAIDAVVLPGPGLVSFSADVVDLPTESAADVARVLVAFRDKPNTAWRFLDLKRGTGANWGGAASVGGTEVEYFMQAVDKWGNVAVSTNKGLLFAGAPPAPPTGGGVEPSLTGQVTAGWFSPSAELQIEADEGVAVSVSIDGGPLVPFSPPVTLTGDGLHTIDVRGSNGYETTLYAPVDSLPPTVVLDQPGAFVPLNGRVPLAFRCLDASSGIATCTATISSPTMPPTPWANGTDVPASPLDRTYTVQLRATDRVGHSTTQEFTYVVRTRGIVYTSSNTGSGDIYLLPADAGPTTAPTRLTETSWPEADPVWSPDTRRIAFAANQDGTWRIYVMDADGTDVKLVPTGNDDATEPAWSPDGGRIAFVSTPKKKSSDIWVVNVDGSNRRQLTTDTKIDVAPTWSPDATEIIWSNGPGGQLDLWKMKANGTGTKIRLTTTEDLNTEAAWGSDGTVAFARRAKGGSRFEIWTMPATGGPMKRIIVSNVRNDTQPSWLQDGRLVFATDRDNERDYDLFRATRPASGDAWPHVRVTNAPGDDRAPNG